MPASPHPTFITQRNLPHWRQAGSIYWITFRLADSLPQTKLDGLKAEKEVWMRQNPEPWTAEQRHDHNARFGDRIQEWLDAGYGSCVLARPEIRSDVKDCLVRFDGDRLALHAAVVMPNHVHALIEPRNDTPLSPLLRGIKGASARVINQRLGRKGALWMDESYDRIVRCENEYAHFVSYICENPIKARLSPDEYWLHP